VDWIRGLICKPDKTEHFCLLGFYSHKFCSFSATTVVYFNFEKKLNFRGQVSGKNFKIFRSFFMHFFVSYAIKKDSKVYFYFLMGF